MVNTPIPHSLRSETVKAAKILRDFTIPSATAGPDKVIPAGILVRAEGLAILTVVRVGFLVTARAGSGIVIAKLGRRKWSAPSAIGIAGLGGGFEVGAEVTDFVIILTCKSAVDAFSKGGNLTLGGNFTIAAGPVGRNVEGDVAVRSPAAIYTYSKTKGLFAGISIEGSYLVERKDANRKFYGEDVRACEILSGQVEMFSECSELYSTLAHHEDMFDKVLEAKGRQAIAHGTRMTGRMLARGARECIDKSSAAISQKLTSGSRARRGPGTSWEEEDISRVERNSQPHSRPRSGSESFSRAQSSAGSSAVGRSRSGQHSMSATSSAITADWDSPIMCKALWSYKAEMPCDLTFAAGDLIEIRTRTHTQQDWWEGAGRDGRLGIFPANYVQLL